MKNYKLNSAFNISLMALIMLVVLICYALPTIMIKEIIDGDTGELLSISQKGLFFLFACIVGLTWIHSLVIMIIQKFKIKKAYSLSKKESRICS